ncbi:MAG TPA: hypothetical protein VGM31_04405 [Puia sp.]|jgi:hypothetical protein
MKILLESVLITIVQALVFILANDLFVIFYSRYIHPPVRHNLAWGISLELFVFVFILITFVNNILCLKYWNRKWLFFPIAFVLFLIVLMQDITYTPYRVALLIGCSVLGFLSFFAVHRFSRRIFRR